MENESNRKVTDLLYAEKVDMGGFPVRQPLPTRNVDMIDPFLLLHHAEIKFTENIHPLKEGVGPHPHRGFSPVTFVFKGGVHHLDSRGNNSVIYSGGTQWMNAGMGIIHSERPPENIIELGGVQEIIQLWINTPRRHKMDIPAYFGLSDTDTPEVPVSDEKAHIKIVSGEYGGIQGPVPSNTEVLALRMAFGKGGSHFFRLPENYNAWIYALDGKLDLGGYGMMEGLNMAVLDTSGAGIHVEALVDTRFILMAGKPLHEPVESYGPFVMTNATEIMEAMRDYQMGKMGVLIEE